MKENSLATANRYQMCLPLILSVSIYPTTKKKKKVSIITVVSCLIQ